MSQRRYKEAADAFLKVTEINSWYDFCYSHTCKPCSLALDIYYRSHGTYYFIAAGCHISLEDYAQAQTLLDAVPELVEKKKIGGKDLPTEVFIKKKRTFMSFVLLLTCGWC